jgi:hypothetical protein
MAILNNSNAISTTGGYDINNSLRFRSSASAYLSRTPAGAGNRQTWTWSGWIKRGSLGTDQAIFSVAGASNTTYFLIKFDTNNCIYIGNYSTNFLVTSQVFRDPSAWYHIVVVLDTTQATANNRLKLYVNGSQVTAFSSNNISAQIAQNSDQGINQAAAHNIGREAQGGVFLLDAYQTEINFINAQALTPSSFGETSTTTGSWVPKAYTGTYGTNGFELNFSDIAQTVSSNVGLGKDFSGNGNYWVTNNISITAGTTYDAMIDSPTLTSATVANYAVLNPLKTPAPASVSYTNGNLSVSCGNGNQTPALVTIYPSSGKWYWEVIWTSGTYARIGVQNTTVASTDFAADTAGWRWESNTGNIYNGSTLATVSTYATGDVLGFCLDLDAGKFYVSKNGTWQNSAVPESGTGAVATNIPTSTLMSPAVATGSLTSVFAFNAGQRPFSYTPPTGFVRLNTFNLPDSAVLQGNKVMDSTLYTGNGTTNAIVNSGSFKPDMVWVKNTGNGYGHNHVLVDSIRGGSSKLFPNLSNAQSSVLAYSSLNSNGFTLENSGGANNDMNESAFSYVAWQWQAGQGSTSSNTSGTITSTVSVNATAGFSVVTYSANAVNATVGHGLGVAPKMVIVKARNDSGRNWATWHTSIPNTQYLNLNTTAGAATDATVWNSTSPTPTVFSIGTSVDTNRSGNTYVAYCWAAIPGYSAFGSYVANASADGPFIYTGFRPEWIMFKRTTSATNWYVIDNSISPYNSSTSGLYPNTTDLVSTEGAVLILSNGFKCAQSSGAFNFPSGETFIYVAYAENPFKNANAR